MREVSADKGYISADNLQTAVDHVATPYIPFKTNVTGKRGTELWKKLFHYYSFNCEEFLRTLTSGPTSDHFQHDQTEVGERLRCKTETAQVNEALCKVLCHNLCVVIHSMY